MTKELKRTWDINADIRRSILELEQRENAACVALFTILTARTLGYLDELVPDFWEETQELVDAMRGWKYQKKNVKIVDR